MGGAGVGDDAVAGMRGDDRFMGGVEGGNTVLHDSCCFMGSGAEGRMWQQVVDSCEGGICHGFMLCRGDEVNECGWEWQA